LALPPITVTPSAAARAYLRAGGTADNSSSVGTGADVSGAGSDFGSVLQRAVQSAVDAGHTADAAAASGIAGNADVTAVVTAVSKAELALQTTVTIRDRVVQAYQDIMKMAI
jgi:flagellar hook-basal body complex protein FliE